MLTDDEILDLVRECDLDWHAGWAADDEDNRYARLVRSVEAALAAAPKSEPVEVYNPWRESLENCISGDNYLRDSGYRSLIEELDDLYRLRAAPPAPVAQLSAEPVAWRYQDARGHYRYRSYVAGFDVEYAILKPVPLYAAPAPAAQPSTEPTTECTTCGATVVRVTGVYDYPPPGDELVRAARDAVDALADILGGWRYIRSSYGDLYGVGWDRADGKAEAAGQALRRALDATEAKARKP